MRDIASLIKWSELRSIGRSPAASAAVIVPFLGFVIIFNEQIVSILAISTQFLRFAEHSQEGELAASARDITVQRLKYIYFGLCFVGLASGFFAVRCPQIIKKYPSHSEYIKAEYSEQTEIAALDTLATLLSDSSGLSPVYAQDRSRIDGLISSLYWHVATRVGSPSEPSPPLSDLKRTLRVWERDPEFGRLLREEIRPFKKDVMRIEYLILDSARGLTRVIVAAFYLIGLAILLIPTLQTFYMVSRILVAASLH